MDENEGKGVKYVEKGIKSIINLKSLTIILGYIYLYDFLLKTLKQTNFNKF